MESRVSYRTILLIAFATCSAAPISARDFHTGETLPITCEHASVKLFAANGAMFTWHALQHTTVPGKVAYGSYGNPGWGTNPTAHQPTPNPLHILGTVSPDTLAISATLMFI